MKIHYNILSLNKTSFLQVTKIFIIKELLLNSPHISIDIFSANSAGTKNPRDLFNTMFFLFSLLIFRAAGNLFEEKTGLKGRF